MPLSLQRLYGERLLQCVQAVVSAGREDCRGAGEPLLEVLVTVLALWGPAGLSDKVSGSLLLCCSPWTVTVVRGLWSQTPRLELAHRADDHRRKNLDRLGVSSSRRPQGDPGFEIPSH